MNRQFCDRLLRVSAGPPLGSWRLERRRSPRPRRFQNASLVNERRRPRRGPRDQTEIQTTVLEKILHMERTHTIESYVFRTLYYQARLHGGDEHGFGNPLVPAAVQRELRHFSRTRTWLSGRILNAFTPRSLQTTCT